jgi:hypothetical protein
MYEYDDEMFQANTQTFFKLLSEIVEHTKHNLKV